ncbi:His-Xaa-Ser system radical SAM maturase HxsC [Novosphingobium profundi]|uniref:His-Xaa-Ser system radical SAM maturase HxsC n=1 Tax=Novosphingobium profundi TaxID=1774954 RepID=UPI001BDA6CBF|nr:His-Xaa-Ser system radical SAM maturase HxsC [Novosphingobium profundi]MBT0671808.1 His-Xaa-Ser system radical SAM maturase HxsC [Novosphingobium profundi]
MIALSLRAASDGTAPFVTRLTRQPGNNPALSHFLAVTEAGSLWSGEQGVFELGMGPDDLFDDVVLVDPFGSRADRLIRKASSHNTLLVTEQCDQLCVMCSQPPKKTHVDRFDLLERACLLADHGITIGISGGEPTLHRARLFSMLESVLSARPDLNFHILSNAQHFTAEDALRLRSPFYRNVVWGVPVYAASGSLHDAIVGKIGAFEKLMESFVHLFRAGARIELRTVLTTSTVDSLDALANFIVYNLAHIEQWSVMGLENIGFAKSGWADLHFDLRCNFDVVGNALDRVKLHGVRPKLFNIPLCHVPAAYRSYAVASISDWKQRFSDKCVPCVARSDCSGFFAWHPSELVNEVYPL